MSKIEQFLEKMNRFTDLHLNLKSRVLVLLAVVCLLLTYAFPLYRMTLKSNFYPEGLVLNIYSYKLTSGHNNTDLREINVLNHYIGMKEIKEEDFPEFTWLPLAFGVIALLALRVIVVGHMSELIDIVVLLIYVGLFGFYRFYTWLYHYGHDLSPKAAIKVAGFTPPLIGFKQIANFGVYNMPHLGVVFLILAVILLIVAIFLSRKPLTTGG